VFTEGGIGIVSEQSGEKMGSDGRIMLASTPIGEIDSPKLKLSLKGLNSLAPDATHPAPVGFPYLYIRRPSLRVTGERMVFLRGIDTFSTGRRFSDLSAGIGIPPSLT
jgi:hypothetical protein